MRHLLYRHTQPTRDDAPGTTTLALLPFALIVLRLQGTPVLTAAAALAGLRRASTRRGGAR